MNTSNSRSMESERELAEAVEKVKSLVKEIEDFKNASETLGEVGKKNADLAEYLSKAATSLRDASEFLSQDGIRKFIEILEGQSDSIAQTLSKYQQEMASHSDKQSEKLRMSMIEIQKIQEGKIQKQLEEIQTNFEEKLNKLKLVVISIGIVSLGLLLYIAFAP